MKKCFECGREIKVYRKKLCNNCYRKKYQGHDCPDCGKRIYSVCKRCVRCDHVSRIGSSNPKNLGKNNGMYNGGRVRGKRGYIQKLVGPDVYQQEHRWVMEQYLGRKLKHEEHVHHINGIRDDNRIENLVLFPTGSDHLKYHWKNTWTTRKSKEVIGWINQVKNVDGLKIDLGAGNPEEGEVQKSDFVLQDVQKHKGIDLVCNILEIDSFITPNQCSEVRISHVLEHFSPKELPIVLKKLNKILKNDGVLTIIVPNFRWHASLVLEGKEEEAVYYCFGGQLDEYDLHKTGFTPTILKTRLQEAGFAIRYIDDNSSITCEALKI